MKILVFALFIMLIACTSYFAPPPPKKPDLNFTKMLNKSKSFENTQIRFNGFYNNETEFLENLNSTEKSKLNSQNNYFATSPIIFFKNGLIYFSHASYTGELRNIPSAITMYGERNWGTFELTNDSIKAIIYCQFSRKAVETKCYLPCYFSGIIKDDETIIDWHMVQPYPKIILETNINRFGSFIKPSILKFKVAGGKTKFNIDSNAVWVNQYRIDK
jgi:hypothetical protein